MKIVSRFALAAVAASGLVFAASAPAAAVDPHLHCLVTPTGYVLIAEGLSEHSEAGEPQLEHFHADVHRGAPSKQLTIVRIEIGQTCEDDAPPLPEQGVLADN
jgi:hypothetical protein